MFFAVQFAAVGNKLTEMDTGASYEAFCEDAAPVCTNLADGEMSAPSRTTAERSNH